MKGKEHWQKDSLGQGSRGQLQWEIQTYNMLGCEQRKAWLIRSLISILKLSDIVGPIIAKETMGTFDVRSRGAFPNRVKTFTEMKEKHSKP